MKNYSADASLAMAVASILINSKKRKPSLRIPTPEEIARHEKEKSRAEWNAAVDAKRAAKAQK